MSTVVPSMLLESAKSGRARSGGLRDSTARRLSQLHARLYRVTGGRIGKRLVDNDMLLLTTRGRSTGRPHTVPLLFLQDGESLVVIASWGGRDYHPDWYLNLLADPTAQVNSNGTRRPVLARDARDGERALWWQRAQEAYPGYEEYQRRTGREIPIVLLEPNT